MMRRPVQWFLLVVPILLLPLIALSASQRIVLKSWSGKPFAKPRSYLLVTPDEQPVRGLILALPGQGATPAGHGRMIRLDQKAIARGIAVAYPAALGKPSHWDQAHCCATAPFRWSDADFLQAVVADVGRRLQRRVPVLAAGFSNGAMLLAAMDCAMELSFRQVVLVSGDLFPTNCPEAKRARPTAPVTIFHGTNDPIIAYRQAFASFRQWCQKVDCRKVGETQLSPSVKCEQFLAGELPIGFCTISTGGHSWPGGAEVPHLGRTVQDFDLSAWLVGLFERK